MKHNTIFAFMLSVFVGACSSGGDSNKAPEVNISEEERSAIERKLDSSIEPEQDVSFSFADGGKDTGLKIKKKHQTYDDLTVKSEGAFVLSTVNGDIKHDSSNLTMKVSGDKEGGVYISSVEGTVELDLASQGILQVIPYLDLSDKEQVNDSDPTTSRVVVGAYLQSGTGKALKKLDKLSSLRLPLQDNKTYYYYSALASWKGGLKQLDEDSELNLFGGELQLVVDAEGKTYYLGGELKGLAGLLTRVSAVGIGVSSNSGIPFVPETVSTYPDFFDQGSINFWDEILESETKPDAPFEFNGNLIVTGRGSLFKLGKKGKVGNKGKGVSISFDNGVIIAWPTTTEDNTVLYGVNGEIFVGLKSDGNELTVKLTEASATYGAKDGKALAYFSGKAGPDFTFSPFGIDLPLGPDAELSGFLHGNDYSQSFLRTRTGLNIGGLKLIDSAIEINGQGMMIGGKTDIGLGSIAMQGIVDNTGVQLDGNTTLKIPLVGTKNVLESIISGAKCGYDKVTDGAKCGFEKISDGAVCGYEKVVDGAKCGYQTVANGALCGYKTVTDGAVCGYKTVTDGAVCGYKTVTSAAECGFSRVSSFFCDAFSWAGLPGKCKKAKRCKVSKKCKKAKSCTDKNKPKSCKDENKPKSCDDVSKPKTCNDVTKPKSCDIPAECEVVKTQIPNHDFGSAQIGLHVSVKGAKTSKFKTDFNGKFCHADGGDCTEFDANLIDVDYTLRKVCVPFNIMPPNLLNVYRPNTSNAEIKACAEF